MAAYTEAVSRLEEDKSVALPEAVFSEQLRKLKEQEAAERCVRLRVCSCVCVLLCTAMEIKILLMPACVHVFMCSC